MRVESIRKDRTGTNPVGAFEGARGVGRIKNTHPSTVVHPDAESYVCNVKPLDFRHENRDLPFCVEGTMVAKRMTG